MLEINSMILGSYMENSYLLRDVSTGKYLVIDPGVYHCEYEAFLKKAGVSEIEYILLTHGHFDHICGVNKLKEKFGGKILIHKEDAECIASADWSLANSVTGYEHIPFEADGFVEDGDEISLGETKITVMHTPGHTRGSVMYITDGFIFSGDTLFRGSMGRTDLPGGSTKTLFKSLRAVGQIEGEYTIYPGHGMKSSLSYEKRNNRYLRANDTSHG